LEAEEDGGRRRRRRLSSFVSQSQMRILPTEDEGGAVRVLVRECPLVCGVRSGAHVRESPTLGTLSSTTLSP